jgi:6-phosphofructo-2-kinase
MTYDDIKVKYPVEYEARLKDKLMYRFPGAGGESYADVIERLKPIIIELERMRVDALVISHNVTMRTLLAYFLGIPLQDLPRIKIPLHTLYCLEPKPYGADLKRYFYNEEIGKMEYIGDGIGEFLP